MRKITFAALLILLLSRISSAYAFQLDYNFEDIWTQDADPEGPAYAEAHGINEVGVVSGRYGSYPGQFGSAFTWNNNSFTASGFGGGAGGAFDINNKNEVTGWAYGPSPFRENKGYFVSGNSITEIPNFDAVKLNENGLILGTYIQQTGQHSPAIWKSGNFDFLPFNAADLNDNNVIVGTKTVDLPTGYQNVGQYRDSSGADHDLQPLTGHFHTEAWAINNNNEIVGLSTPETGTSHFVKWSNDIPTDLGELPTTAPPRTLNINGDFIFGQYLWKDGEVHDLRAFLPSDWTAYSFTDMNDSGQIVGYGFGDTSIAAHGFRLTPVVTPEPGSMALFGLGAGVLALVRRSRRRDK